MSEDESDKALWLTLAQSWVRLAEHVARHDLDAEFLPEEGSDLVPGDDWEFEASEDELA